jgi:hypothetical protein
LLPTVTVTLCMALVPPGPVHCAEKVLFDVMLLIVCVPDVATVPLQSPDPVHEVASVDDHVSVVLPPIATDIGLAVSESVGSGGASGSCSSPPVELQALSKNAEAANPAARVRNMVNGESCADSRLAVAMHVPRFATPRTSASSARLNQPNDPPPEPESVEPPPPPPPPPAVTVTVTLSLAEPPAPEQLRE